MNEPSHWLSHRTKTRHLSVALHNALHGQHQLINMLAPSTLLDPIAGDQWLAVDDAASCYDPITSEGIYKAFANGIAAAKAIETYFHGDKHSLQRYASLIQAQFSDYLRNRYYFYAREQRWPKSDFWQRRQVRGLAV